MSEESVVAAAHALFERIIEMSPAEREAVLAEACAGRPELRGLVAALLESDIAASTLLDIDPAQLIPALMADDADIEGIGPYRVIEELGRGGMGTVYLAERADGEYEQQVAIKLVKRGMDTDEIIERFRQERRILASLEHPNIARLFDGGVSMDGRPYLVMELTRGEPVTEFCDRRSLPIDERLALFAIVCAAVQHAHQKLVVHRDIKPSNIVVTADGTPRLLDFGIARLLDDSSATAPRTRTGVLVMTPEYAAPEQLRGEPVSTATDVHALGVVLYELLVGRRPFDRAGASTHPPERPSTAALRSSGDLQPADVAASRSTTSDRLRRRLAGDLDAIALKALDPDPVRRYGSAQQLLDDIDRHVSGRPVHATSPTLAYVARKFMRRHRPALIAATIILITLIGGLGATAWQAQRAARARRAAELARSGAEQVAAFLVSIFDSADPLGVRPERTDTLRVREVVDRAALRVQAELADQPRIRATMLTTLGRVYANLGDFDRAELMLHDAIAAAESVGDTANVQTLMLLANTAQQQGEFARADSLLRQVLDRHDPDVAPDSLHAAASSQRGLALMYLGEYDQARALHEQALSEIVRLGGEGGSLHSTALGNLATLYYQMGEYAEAERVFRDVLTIERATLPESHPRIASTLNNLASSMQYQGRHDDALPLYEEAIASARSSLGPDHSEFGNYVANMASLYDEMGRLEEAEPLYLESIRAHEASLGRTNVNTALLLRNFALNRYDLGKLDEAEVLLREALTSIEAGLGDDHLYTAVTAAALGRVLMRLGRMDEAGGFISEGLASLEAHLPATHHLVATSRRDLGAYHAQRGDFATAEPLLLESYRQLLDDRGANHYLTREARAHLHALYLAQDDSVHAAEFADEPESPTDR